jgi:hypothetical protein
MSDYTEHLISMAGGDGEADVLGEIEARANAATMGPWHVWDDGDVATTWTRSFTRRKSRETYTSEVHIANCGGADANFIAHARTDIPALLAMVREHRAVIERVQELADDMVTRTPNVPEYDLGLIRLVASQFRAALTATEAAK